MQDHSEEKVLGVTYVPNGLDNTIKVFVLIKVMLQTAFWGLMLGVTIWFLVANPLPELIAEFQRQTAENLMDGFR